MKKSFNFFTEMICLLLIVSIVPAFSQEAYKIELMWPRLDQLWYFSSPKGVAVNSSGHVYVADTGNDRIQKFDSNGTLMTDWGSQGAGDGQFDGPCGTALDSSGNVYVADTGNNRIQKFDSNGRFIAQWGSLGGGNRKFDSPMAVTVDSSGDVYVADSNNHCIQKFNSTGRFITQWGSFGEGVGQFRNPLGVAVDSSGNVYVADTGNDRIQKFHSNGSFITKWGSYGTGDGQFQFPTGVAVDTSGNVYVNDWLNRCIQQFDSKGNFITKVALDYNLRGIAIDSLGTIYTTTDYSDCIVKIDSSGIFVAKWCSWGREDGRFHGPSGLSIDHSGNVYVADAGNHRIQKFDSNGNFITSWTANPDGITGPDGIATDSSGDVYVVNSGTVITPILPPPPTPSVRKFDSDGDFLTQWGSLGTGDGQFNPPRGIGVDLSANVYVADTGNHRIQKFDSNGNFITKWGSTGTDDGEFQNPQGIAVDSSENVYVADSGNNRVQKFDSNRNFITKWGSEGTDEGQFRSPQGLALDSSGNIYVADTGNHRIQKFSPNLGPQETISTPNPPSGPGSGFTGASYTFTAGGSSSDFGHPLEYRLDWGDDTLSNWSSSISVSKSWPSPNTYIVRAKARCAIDRSIESDWSEALTVTINNPGPDLTGSWTTPLTQGCRTIGWSQRCTLKGTLTVSNIGNIDASSTFVNLYVSDSSTYKGGDIQLKSMATGKMRAGKSKVIRFNYSFPMGQNATNKYIIAVIDKDNSVAEIEETNNQIVHGPIP